MFFVKISGNYSIPEAGKFREPEPYGKTGDEGRSYGKGSYVLGSRRDGSLT